MMRNLSESLTFTVPLSLSVHAKAEQFCRQQRDHQKAKQVYLNTLAVSAVNFYLRCMGIEADWEASHSVNSVMYSLMDVADLEVKKLGKLECIPVLPKTQVIQIPPEAWLDRIGYVAVRLNESLREAMLLGFSETAGSGELLISQLRSLENLLEHLRHLQQSEPVKLGVHLSQWFENIFEASWQSLEALLGTNRENLTFSLRTNISEVRVQRAKLIDLGVQLGSQSVVLLVAIAPEADQKLGIVVQVHPADGQTYLPSNLRLMLLSQAEEILQEVSSRRQDNYIQLRRFRGQPGESFKIKVTFGTVSMQETFII